ncbi:hypothetical protein [Streptomyces sp. FL07-04A]|uniref:hypothetical protein n=1 Tax=Streptomyces sp. FL07-04A TaxID=3028658 RepID=UPI0029A6B68C|nr:hypothetical protein [Streptomyces sp. FL07-04A]MDX3575943.1 hypothetical protein [Streptomyces sp. FL07-04A]
MNHTTDQTRLTVTLYDAIDVFQRTHRLPGLQHAQIRGLLAEHLARVLPAALPSVVVSADRATLRDRIADTVMPFLLNFSDEESARINAAEVADALLSVLPAPAPVCICGHSKQQHFEDACITEITGCNCGDYLEPQDAAEVIDRWRQAALQARAADRAKLLREAEAPTDWIDGHPQLEAIAAAVWEKCGRSDSGLIIDDPRNIAVAALAAVLPAPADGPSRVAAEEQPAETQCSCGGAFPVRHLHADEHKPVGGEQPDTQTREAFVPPAHYRGRDGTAYCVHATPIGPDSCRHCRELAE